MDRRTTRLLVTISTLCTVLAGAPAGWTAEVPPEPAAMPSPGVKTRPGCCCYKNPQAPDGWACTWGWQENRCKSIAADLKKVGLSDGEYRWNEGRCPASSTAEK